MSSLWKNKVTDERKAMKLFQFGAAGINVVIQAACGLKCTVCAPAVSGSAWLFGLAGCVCVFS